MEGAWQGAGLTMWQSLDSHSIRVILRIRYFSARIDADTYPPGFIRLAKGPCPRPPPSDLRSRILWPRVPTFWLGHFRCSRRQHGTREASVRRRPPFR